MKRQELERKYKKCGLPDYRLRNIGDLKAVHGIDVTELKGYSGLTDENRELFNSTVVRFFNAWGLDIRSEIRPKAVYFALETRYAKDLGEKWDDEPCKTVVGETIHSVDRNGRKQERYKYDYGYGIDFAECETDTKAYLRFELRNAWYHIEQNGEWY